MNYYNEIDPGAVAWLRELIARKLIPPGEIDNRSIIDVRADDIRGFTQCHFFCGIGGWPFALRLAGFPEDRQVWTGSCPCQPFSAAGQGRGVFDPRHLWPYWFPLIRECHPAIVFGEQVASRIALGWLDGVFADLEGEAYTCGAADLCAPCVFAPHIRQRLHWGAIVGVNEDESGVGRLADTGREYQGRAARSGSAEGERAFGEPSGCDPAGGMGDTPGGGWGELWDSVVARGGGHTHRPGGHQRMADSVGAGLEGHAGDGSRSDQSRRDDPDQTRSVAEGRTARGLAHTEHDGGRTDEPEREEERRTSDGGSGFWSDFDIIYCRDGKCRRVPVEPEIFPLVDGLSYRVGSRGSIRPALLKGAGNAIVPEEATEFIKAFLEARGSI